MPCANITNQQYEAIDNKWWETFLCSSALTLISLKWNIMLFIVSNTLWICIHICSLLNFSSDYKMIQQLHIKLLSSIYIHRMWYIVRVYEWCLYLVYLCETFLICSPLGKLSLNLIRNFLPVICIVEQFVCVTHLPRFPIISQDWMCVDAGTISLIWMAITTCRLSDIITLT